MSKTTKSSLGPFNGLCHKCGEAGHRAAECPAATAQIHRPAATAPVHRPAAKAPVHCAADCPTPVALVPPVPDLCGLCGTAGHSAGQCPAPELHISFRGFCRQCGVDSHLTEDCPVASGKALWVEAMERAIGTCADHVAEACNKVFCETPPKLRDRIGFRVARIKDRRGGFTFSFTVSRSDPVESGAVAVSDAVAVSCKRPTQRGGGQKKKGAATTVAVTATAAAAANSLAKGA